MQTSKLLLPASSRKRSSGVNSPQPTQARLEDKILPATNFATVLRGSTLEDGGGKGVRVAVEPDDFSFGRRRRRRVAFEPQRLLARVS